MKSCEFSGKNFKLAYLSRGGNSQTVRIFVLRNGDSEPRGVVGLGGSLASLSVVGNLVPKMV